MLDRSGRRERDDERRRARPTPAPARPRRGDYGPGALLALQRAAGNHAVARVLARSRMNYIPDRAKMSDTVDLEIGDMTEAQLQDVIQHAGKPYSKKDVQEARNVLLEKHPPSKTVLDATALLLQPTIDTMDQEARDLVDKLNDPARTDSEFTADATALLKLKTGAYAKFNAALSKQAYDERALVKLRLASTSPIETALDRVNQIKKNLPQRAELLKKKRIPYPGVADASVINYRQPTTESNAALVRPGIQALKGHGFADEDLHHAFNALDAAYALSSDHADQVERWLQMLDAMVPLWTHVKPDSAAAWLSKALLPKGTTLWAHFKGMFGELWETHRVLSTNEFAPGTQIRMGKDKLRPETQGMKQNAKPTTTQDIDLSFHGADGKRHYHEIKADPDTIVGKIGVDETKDAVIAGTATGADAAALDTTPDQILSYASTRDEHESKASKDPSRYTAGKEIVLMYVAPITRNWLRVFTSKAGQRLIAHRFGLRIGATSFDTAELIQVQAKVDKLAPPADPARDDWAKANSRDAKAPYGDPAKFLTV